MSCKKSLERAIRAGQMIKDGIQPVFKFSSLEKYKIIQSMDCATDEDVEIFSVQFNDDGTQVVTGGMNSLIRVINISQSSKKSQLTMKPSKHNLGMPITCLRHLPKSVNIILASSPSGRVYMCNKDKEGYQTVIKEANEIYAFDISPDGMELATCGRDRNIRIYRCASFSHCDDTRMGELIPKFYPTAVDEDITECGHGMTIHSVKFHPDNSCLLLSAGWDRIVKMWDVRMKMRPVWKISGPHICSPDGLDIKGNELFTASWREKNALELWDLRNAAYRHNPLKTVPVIGKGWECENGDTEYLYGVKICDNHSVATSGSGFKGIRVVNKETHQPIGEVYAGTCVNAMDIVFGGRQIVGGCADGSLVFCRMN